MSIVQHPLWPEVKPFMRLEKYDRDGGHQHPRYRIEVTAPTSGIVLRELLALEMGCVSCGRTIHPIRMRQGKHGHLYYAATCELAVNYGCARSSAARREYQTVKDALSTNGADHDQPTLWG